MASFSQTIIVGYLGADPEVRAFPDGGKVANASVATTEKWKDNDSGEMREATEWHRLVFNNRLAEVADRFLRKGSFVQIVGRLRTRKYVKDGIDHYTTEIRVDSVQLLDRRPAGDDDKPGKTDSSGSRGSAGSARDSFSEMDDDVPF